MWSEVNVRDSTIVGRDSMVGMLTQDLVLYISCVERDNLSWISQLGARRLRSSSMAQDRRYKLRVDSRSDVENKVSSLAVGFIPRTLRAEILECFISMATRSASYAPEPIVASPKRVRLTSWAL